MSDFIVEFECPQCGAPASLEETSRLFICTYCSVKSYLVPQDVFHYVLPSRAPEDKEIIYFPYWRFRGVLFVCVPDLTVHSEPINEILQAAPSDFFPYDLGFKAQVIKMRFTGQEFKGRIFEPTIPFEEAVQSFDYLNEMTYHSQFIGLLETIYAPFYIQDSTIYDGISNKRVDMFYEYPIEIDGEMVAQLPPVGQLSQDMKFIPTLCPHCGWDVDCARDSYLMACKNCGSFCKPQWAGLKKMGVGFLPGDTNTALYLPFYRIQAEITGTQLHTYGDLIRVGNLTKVVKEEEAKRSFYFWVPAFKLGSGLFLQIATRVTLGQPNGRLERSMPKIPAYPVNLPISEAVKGLKSIFADFIALREINYPKLQDISIVSKRLALIYFPFEALGSEIVHPQYKVRVSSKTLEHFRL